MFQKSRRIDCSLSDEARLKAAVLTLDSVEEKMGSGEYKRTRWILVLDQSGKRDFLFLLWLVADSFI